MTERDLLQEIRQDIRDINKSLSRINETSIKHNEELKAHTRRSTLNEDSIQNLKTSLFKVEERLTSRLDTDQTFRRWFLGVSTIIGPVSALAVAVLYKIFT